MNESSEFKLFHWNILDPKLANENEYPKVKSEYLNWSKRKQKIELIINEYKPDFVSLCEYPSDENLNLSMIEKLKKDFKCPIGYSGHENSVSPTIVAYILGAEYLERHITLDRAMWGTDQAASLSEKGIRNLSSIINKIPHILGKPIKKYFEEEKKCHKK